MSATFSVTRDEMSTAALRLCGAIGSGVTPTSSELSDCAQAMQILLKSWADKGYKGWLYGSQTFAFVANKATWTLGESGADVTMVRPERIVQVWWQDTATVPNKTDMIGLAREQFLRLTPALETGVPNSWYYNPQLLKGELNIWPLCVTGLTGNFGFSYQRPISDLGAGSSTFDVPQQWYNAVKWNLAQAVMLEFRVDERIMNRIDKWAPVHLADAANYTEEDASVFFTPSPMMGLRGFGGRG